MFTRNELVFILGVLTSVPILVKIIRCKFHQDCSSRSPEVVVTISVRTNEQTDNPRT